MEVVNYVETPFVTYQTGKTPPSDNTLWGKGPLVHGWWEERTVQSLWG